MKRNKLTEVDSRTLGSFQNFLSWGPQPRNQFTGFEGSFPVPPAVIAYMWGLTTWCPPKGEL